MAGRLLPLRGPALSPKEMSPRFALVFCRPLRASESSFAFCRLVRALESSLPPPVKIPHPSATDRIPLYVASLWKGIFQGSPQGLLCFWEGLTLRVSFRNLANPRGLPAFKTSTKPDSWCRFRPRKVWGSLVNSGLQELIPQPAVSLGRRSPVRKRIRPSRPEDFLFQLGK